jgi:hypothetical protein
MENQIHATKQNDELFFTVPRPNKVLQYQALPFLTIGGITLGDLRFVSSHSELRTCVRVFGKDFFP